MNRASQQTSIEAVEKAALELLAVQGFDDTSAEEIAAAAGISRRTFFRYFGTKNNIPFGNYSALLRELEDWLSSQPDDRPMFEVIVDAVVRFNRVHTDGPVAHRERMELIMHTPALRANAALVNAEWQGVLARYAALRMGEPPEALGPQLVAHVSLGAASAAYEQWLRDESSDLVEIMQRAFEMAQALPDLEAGKAPSRRRKRRPTSGR
ncbi:MAG TPA: TetR family transcriptional regulator [Acidimicrobiales bacterium]|nr:TetR family transcriptional regulator [Acidimicrobiales bacterium]